MPLIDIRELLEFPTTPGNTSDTEFGGVHFNLTTLNQWNYTYYSNGTISNGSWCILAFDPYTPVTLFPNGTFINSTTCYTPIYSMGPRGSFGVGLSVFFAISIMFTFINLRKHGRLFLPAQLRFRPIGRRWQWYWMIAVAACGMISGIGSVDVDRYYLPEFPIVLTNLGYFLMLPCIMGAVWESVRHWGSWQERQVIDPNPFALPQDDKRGKTEFYLPLIFYMFNFLNFFMTVTRAWDPIEEQRSPEQTEEIAEVESTDTRFKAGAFLLFIAWCVICFSLWHSIHHYKPRNRGPFHSFVGFLKYTPVKFILTIPLALVVVGYEALIAFKFDFSTLNVHGNVAFIYGLGWAPVALIVLIYEISGYIDPNEDRDLIRQRRIRGMEADREMGYTKKPNWWSRLHGDVNLTVHETLSRNVREVGGGQATRKNIERDIEMGVLKIKSQTSEAAKVEDSALHPATSGTSALLDPFSDNPRHQPADRGRIASSVGQSSAASGTAWSERSTSTASGTTLNAPPQKIRSMLDI